MANTKPRDEYRALPLGYELRTQEDGMPTLVGELAVFNEWTEINSASEGHFVERIAPGAFDKTISENRERMKVLFNHGNDPQIGDKPLGPIAMLEPTERAVNYEVPLLDTTYNRELLPGLEAGLYGSSFRFSVLREDFPRSRGEESDYNPKGLRERTVKEVRMPEFGPVTFPAYFGAKSGLRSLTDRMAARVDADDLGCLAQMIALGSSYIEDQDEDTAARMSALLEQLVALSQDEVLEDEPAEERTAETKDAPPKDRAGESHPIYTGRRVERAPLYVGRREESPVWKL